MRIQNYIDGSLVASNSSRTVEVMNPATGEAKAVLPMSDADDLNNAVESAKVAAREWRSVTPLARARILERFKALLEQNADELATLISMEHGKVHTDALGELKRGIEVVEFACGGPHLLKGEVTENVGTNVDSYSVREPLGVVAGVTPFNFPVMVPLWMFPIAVACGNAFILKPSELVPSAALRLGELFSEAGLPDGVFNIVNGDKDIVREILNSRDVQAVSFVGSTPVAKEIYARGAENGKRVQALGGAKNHMVIMPDTDIDKAAEALIGAAFGSAGERCMAISVAVPVTDEVGDRLVEKLRRLMQSLNIGPADDPRSDMGPLVSQNHLKKVLSYVDSGVAEGADLIVDGREFVVEREDLRGGYFLGASLFDRVTPDMRIYKDEIFGPVLSVVRANDFQSAVSIVNANEFGNGVSIFTNNGAVARAFARQIQVGMVGINVPIPVPMAFHSFGGWKNSLFGDHNMHGPEGIRFYTKPKTITSRWSSSKLGIDFAMPTLA